ncbi:MAG: hypothetical protein P4L87_22790 [Formivibrio sp.]|nr:hypothetical protein [Formivibrio sp.]
MPMLQVEELVRQDKENFHMMANTALLEAIYHLEAAKHTAGVDSSQCQVAQTKLDKATEVQRAITNIVEGTPVIYSDMVTLRAWLLSAVPTH